MKHPYLIFIAECVVLVLLLQRTEGGNQQILAVGAMIVVSIDFLIILILLRTSLMAYGVRKHNGIPVVIASLALLLAFIKVPEMTFDLIRPVQKDLIDAAEQVCAGQAYPDTASLDNSVGIHPVVMKYAGGRFLAVDPSEREYPKGWLPASDKEMQLVACLKKEKRELGTCEYTAGKSLATYIWYMHIDVYEAKKGRLVQSFDLTGPSPTCPGVVTTGESEIEGEQVSMADIIKTISPLVDVKQ